MMPIEAHPPIIRLPARNLSRDALALVGILWLIVGFGILGYSVNWFVDALAYWSVDPFSPYGGLLGDPGTFTYTPAAAQVFIALGHLPRELFLVTWTAVNVALLAWLTRPWPWILLILAAPIADELITGQIEIILTAAIVAGFRWPGLWALPLLTKASPGVGVLWFAARREWRSLAIAGGVTLAIAAVSFLLEPRWWADWIAFLRSSATGDTHQLPIVRVPIAALLVVWAARTDRAWLVPVAAMLALPVIWMHSLVMLTGVLPLRSWRRTDH